MKKATFFLFTIIYLYASAIASDHKKLSQFTGDFNGDGYIDFVIASGTNNRDFFGLIKVFFGTTNGINSTAGWAYNCDLSNYLQSKFFVNVIDDVNGDGTDELCLLLTNLKNGKSGRSHQDIFLFYGKKEGLENNPEILKIETGCSIWSSLFLLNRFG